MIVGIDPGLHGAIAGLHPDGSVKVFDMPIVRVHVNGKNRHELDYRALGRLFQDEFATSCPVVMEAVHAMPAQGVTSSFAFGAVYGALRQAIADNFDSPVALVQPATWKRHFGLIGAGKDASREEAAKLYPLHKHLFAAKKHDGRAEAVLIARFFKETVG